MQYCFIKNYRRRLQFDNASNFFYRRRINIVWRLFELAVLVIADVVPADAPLRVAGLVIAEKKTADVFITSLIDSSIELQILPTLKYLDLAGLLFHPDGIPWFDVLFYVNCWTRPSPHENRFKTLDSIYVSYSLFADPNTSRRSFEQTGAHYLATNTTRRYIRFAGSAHMPTFQWAADAYSIWMDSCIAIRIPPTLSSSGGTSLFADEYRRRLVRVAGLVNLHRFIHTDRIRMNIDLRGRSSFHADCNTADAYSIWWNSW